ncbi:MAG TPA: rhodanese-like domain-containing protein [Phycisphaerae bacterium]|nr:rhodanese-like domain-containing protein [Phycisphaerae bacterium]
MTVKTIEVGEFRKLIEGGNTITLIDVRTPGEFTGRHVVGARLMPLDGLDAGAVAALRAGPGEAVYVLCEKGGRAAKACEKLMAAGMGEVYSVAGGTAACESAGVPMERGRGAISLERQVRIAAGALVFVGTVLGWVVHPGFLVVPGFVGGGLVFAGVTDFCGMGILLGRMPWNRGSARCAT